MRRLIFSLFSVIFFLSAVGCSFHIHHICSQIFDREKTVEWELAKNTVVNLKQLSSTETKENTLGCLFYEQEQQETLTNRDLNRSSQATAIRLYGNSSLLFNDAYPLTPNSPDECLINIPVALELFGDSNVYDAVITWQNKDYTVKGVLPESELPLFIVETNQSSDTFSYLYCKQFDPLLGEETMNAYFLANNINASESAMTMSHKNLMSLITKENTYYEILFLRNLKDIVTFGHMLVFLSLLTTILLFSMWRQYRGKGKI